MTKAGIPVRWHDGWATRNRGQRGDGWGKTEKNPTGVHGVMLHHTATRDLNATLRIVRDVGQPENDVPPPLYAGVVDKSGLLHMVAWGRCNHAGLGDAGVLKAVIAEQPAPRPQKNTVDGNARFYGLAGLNLGDMRDPWPAAQLETLGHVAGIICKAHGWTRNSVIGHNQWQVGKPDPRGPQGNMMPSFRQLAHEVLS